MTKHFDPRYHPRKRVLATVSPKKTIAGYCITQENRPPALDETFLTLGISQENGSLPPYHPRKQLLATVSLKKTGHWHLTKHFPTTYHPRKRILDTVSPKKTIAGYCITQENRPPALDETFPTYVSPKVSPRKQLLATVSLKKTGHWHLMKHFPTTYHPRKRVLYTVSPKKTIVGYCITKKTGHQHLTKHFPPTYHPRYHPRKQLLATVSPKKTGHQHLTKHFPTRYHPRKRVLDTVSPKKTIAGYCITQENRPPALDETFPTYVSPKKMGCLHSITQEYNCSLLYHARKQATGT